MIAAGADIGDGTTIGAHCVIGPNVRLGRDNIIAAHVVIEGRTTFGDLVQARSFASIGSAPQDDHWRGRDGALAIGDAVSIGEYVTVQPGMSGPRPRTTVGDGVMLMPSSHVAHDCRVGDGARLGKGATLAGHVEIGAYAWLGRLCAVHQFARVGAHAFVTDGAIVVRDVPPFCRVAGDRARLVRLNGADLGRHGFTPEDVVFLEQAYATVFDGPGSKQDRMAALRAELGERRGVKLLLDFLTSSKRGVMAA